MSAQLRTCLEAPTLQDVPFCFLVVLRLNCVFEQTAALDALILMLKLLINRCLA
jgi:hypothetical protein